MTELNPEVPTFMVLAYREAKANIDNLQGNDFEKTLKLGYWSGVAQCLEYELAVIGEEHGALVGVAGLINFVNSMLERSKDES